MFTLSSQKVIRDDRGAVVATVSDSGKLTLSQPCYGEMSEIEAATIYNIIEFFFKNVVSKVPVK